MWAKKQKTNGLQAVLFKKKLHAGLFRLLLECHFSFECSCKRKRKRRRSRGGIGGGRLWLSEKVNVCDCAQKWRVTDGFVSVCHSLRLSEKPWCTYCKEGVVFSYSTLGYRQQKCISLLYVYLNSKMCWSPFFLLRSPFTAGRRLRGSRAALQPGEGDLFATTSYSDWWLQITYNSYTHNLKFVQINSD